LAGSSSQEVAIKNISAGVHTFYAILVGNDHMPIMPMTSAMVQLNVQHSG
jgi:hypothetical protein